MTKTVTLPLSLSPTEAKTRLKELEDELLFSLTKEKLVVATIADLKPGLALFYPLGDGYGCHILRNNAQLPQGYKPDTDFAGGVRAGTFYILQDNGKD